MSDGGEARKGWKGYQRNPGKAIRSVKDGVTPDIRHYVYHFEQNVTEIWRAKRAKNFLGAASPPTPDRGGRFPPDISPLSQSK